MKRTGNAGYGRMIADSVLTTSTDRREYPPVRTWLNDWIEPAPVRARARRWLSMWLKSDLKEIPADQAARYLQEMATDLTTIGLDGAVDRFIDKILPRIISNGAPDETNTRD